MSTLADRIRGVLGGAPGPIGPGLQLADGAAPSDVGRVLRTRQEASNLESALGGDWRTHGGAACFVVESRREPSSRHGSVTIGDLADQLGHAGDDVPLLAGFPARPPFLFFDLETTGLSGGAGTYAFLVGCAWFDDDGGFVTRQFMLVRLADERALLASVAEQLSGAGALVSFNGRSFDAPLIETRYLYHRLPWAGAMLPHVDMLHIARRFWKRPEPPGVTGESGCSLVALERQLLGHRRHGDVPGVEIPQRYFQFVRSGDARPLAPVFEHNRLDLLSLAALTARAVQLVGAGSAGAREPREALALGAIYTRAGLDARALEAYQRGVELASASSASSASSWLSIECLRALAGAFRRARRFEEAAVSWRRILEVRGCPPQLAREAHEALAIHHEHRVRDLIGARTFALLSLETEDRASRAKAVRHRLARIDRKLESVKPDASSPDLF